MEDAAMLSSHLIEDVTAVETIKTFGQNGGEESRREQAGRPRAIAFRIAEAGAQHEQHTLCLTALAGVVILWYGGHRVMDGALTIGQLMFFYTLLGYLLEPLERLASVNLKIQDALVAVDRLYQVMDLEVEAARRGAPEDGVRAGARSRSSSATCQLPVRLPRRSAGGLNLRIPAGRTWPSSARAARASRRC